MSKGPGVIAETPQQRALAEYASNQLTDYDKRWLPLQKNLASQIEAMGKPDSAVRRVAEGRSATDTGIKFGQAQEKLQASAANTGGIGSSSAKLAIVGLGDDEAKSKGLGITAADQQIDEAYTQQLGALAATGRGEKSQVVNSLTNQATASARQASADAEAALSERMGIAKSVGIAGGVALQGAFGKDPEGGNPAFRLGGGGDGTTMGTAGSGILQGTGGSGLTNQSNGWGGIQP